MKKDPRCQQQELRFYSKHLAALSEAVRNEALTALAEFLLDAAGALSAQETASEEPRNEGG